MKDEFDPAFEIAMTRSRKTSRNSEDLEMKDGIGWSYLERFSWVATLVALKSSGFAKAGLRGSMV